MVNLNVFDHLGPILGPSGPFWTILDKNDFLPQMDKVGVGRGASEQNINSCLKQSKRVQMGPKGSSSCLLCVGCLWNPTSPCLEHKYDRNL